MGINEQIEKNSLVDSMLSLSLSRLDFPWPCPIVPSRSLNAHPPLCAFFLTHPVTQARVAAQIVSGCDRGAAAASDDEKQLSVGGLANVTRMR